MTRNQAVVESLIEGELSASEAYRQVIERGAGAAARGTWGVWSGALERTESAEVVRVLMAAEEGSIREYERALESPRLPADFKRLIASTLLPQARSHLPVLLGCRRRRHGRA